MIVELKAKLYRASHKKIWKKNILDGKKASAQSGRNLVCT